MLSSILVSTVLVTFVHLGESGSFLAQQEDYLSTYEIDLLLAEENASGNLESFEVALRPLVDSLPKNDLGRLEPSVVRYALHRYFAQEYGWHFRGLDTASASANASEILSEVVMDRVPEYIEGLLKQNSRSQGLGLKEVAMFAAALSDLVHRETVQHIEDMFLTWDLPQSGRVNDQEVLQVLKAFLMVSMRGHNRKGTSVEDYRKLERELRELCFSWRDAQLWLEDLRKGAEISLSSRHNHFVANAKFDEVVAVANILAQTFGKFQNVECHAMKDRLVEMEDGGTGRVPLNRFYGGVKDPDWPFFESAEYLRNLGALDETNPQTPSVIIPNYLGSFTFCAHPSKYYSVCCLDECEGLLGHIERAVAQPLATPAELASVVSLLESDTVAAPRNLSTLQHKRLEEIAAVNGGKVPLHGRLFSQWMHHAYPRECRYPHVSGTTNPLTQSEFVKVAPSLTYEATDEEMYMHINSKDYSAAELAVLTDEAKVESMPWSTTEELVSAHRQHMRNMHSTSSLTKFVLLLAAVISASVPAWKASQKLGQFPGQLTRAEKQLV